MDFQRMSHLAVVAFAVPVASTVPATDSRAVVINEIRIDQDGTNFSEYFELFGTSGESLDDLTYVVLGDLPATGSGTIEAAIRLTGLSIPDDGYFLAAEGTFENGPGDPFEDVTADLEKTLNFENNDNVTHLLVRGYSGRIGEDLDLNDDGTLNLTPWTEVVNAIGLIETELPDLENGQEWYYGEWLGGVDLGPDLISDQNATPRHVVRSPDGGETFEILPFDDMTLDTPGGPAVGSYLLGDMDLNDVVDFDDIDDFVLGLSDQAAYESAHGIGPVAVGDTDGNGLFDFDDITGFVAILGGAATDAAVVPEPATGSLLFAAGLVGMAWHRRRR